MAKTNQSGEIPYGYQKTPYGYGVIPGGPLDPQINKDSTAKAIPFKDLPVAAPASAGITPKKPAPSYFDEINDTTDAFGIYKDMAKTGLTSSEAAAAAAREQLKASQADLFGKTREEIDTYSKLLDTVFAPSYKRVDENLERTVDTADLNAASRGSARGSRQEDKVMQLNQSAEDARMAIDAQREAQMRLYEAQLRGATAGELKVYQDALVNAEDNVKQAENVLAQAEQGILSQQLSLEESRRVAEQEAFKNYLEESGQYYNPITGQFSSSLSGQQKSATIDKTIAESIYSEAKGAEAKANAAKLLDEIQRGNFITNSFADEFGNTSIQVFNKDTGEYEITDVGKLSPTASAILSAQYGGRGGGGGSGSGGSDISALAASLVEQGQTSADVARYGAEGVPGVGKLPSKDFNALIGDMRFLEGQAYDYKTALNQGTYANGGYGALINRYATGGAPKAYVPLSERNLTQADVWKRLGIGTPSSSFF